MLYTRKGDGGTTKTFDAKPGIRISKSSCQTEALGALDELNSFLGLAKVKSRNAGLGLSGKSFEEIVHAVQQTLFIVQAELAGAPKAAPPEKITEMESVIDAIEKKLPPIKTFFISGGTELAASFDFARTLARRAERKAVAHNEVAERKMSEFSMSYLNRLSSLLYALARLANHKSGIKEEPPSYK